MDNENEAIDALNYLYDELLYNYSEEDAGDVFDACDF